MYSVIITQLCVHQVQAPNKQAETNRDAMKRRFSVSLSSHFDSSSVQRRVSLGSEFRFDLFQRHNTKHREDTESSFFKTRNHVHQKERKWRSARWPSRCSSIWPPANGSAPSSFVNLVVLQLRLESSADMKSWNQILGNQMYFVLFHDLPPSIFQRRGRGQSWDKQREVTGWISWSLEDARFTVAVSTIVSSLPRPDEPSLINDSSNALVKWLFWLANTAPVPPPPLCDCQRSLTPF